MIKNIIFDFGDIFINLDKEGTYKAMAALGVTNITPEMIEVYHQYEKGLMTTEDFINFYYNKFKINKTDLVAAWNAVLLDFPQRRLDFLKELAASKKYRLFLLSNTNELHIQSVIDTVGETFFNEFKDCFEQFYLSHEIHFRKPDSEIYEFVLNENNLIAEETLFVDDLKENTDSANTLGIQTWNLTPKQEDVTELFSKTNI
ncbi:HAD family hydrolase [Polaribacter sp. Asnod6-C07]|uniref:HAD family hydrolase n=1 Tax=Polaribacter sp. Asnod6-C07 TaxID=3160582 RepID=UPI00386C1BD4